MMQDPDELLASALAQLGRERGSFPGPLPPITTVEDDPMNTVNDDYEIYVDHEDGQRIKSRPIEKKKEIFIGPDGRPLPEDVQEQIRGYGSEDEVSNAFYDELFKIARANSANPESKFIRDPGGSGKLIKFHTPIDLRSLEQKMGGYPFNQI